MKNKLIIILTLIAFLAPGLVFLSCDNGTTTPEVVIPTELQGTYFVAGYIMVINANGKGTIDGAACSFSTENSVLTATMGSETVSVTYNAGAGGKIEFSNEEGEAGYLKSVFTFIAAAAAVKPDTNPVVEAVIPNELVGTWGNVTIDSLLVPELFIINSDGSGKTYNTETKGLDTCLWSVNGNKLTLSVAYGGEYGTLVCTFTYAVANNKLTLSGAVPDSNLYSAALAGYTGHTPVDKVGGGLVAGIGDFVWKNAIPSEYAGNWTSTVPAFTAYGPIFKINANGTGQIFVSSDPYSADSTFAMTADKTRIKITAKGFGGVMYNCAITSNQLSVTDPTLAVGASSGLGAYIYFNPLGK